MRQLVAPGKPLDVLTPAEAAELLREQFRETVIEHIRAEATKRTDAGGSVEMDVYAVPIGFEFEARRLTVDADGITASVGSQNLVNLELRRSGRRILWGPLEQSLGQVPGQATWGQEQGPYLRNGEIFQLFLPAGQAATLQNVNVQVTLDGLLRRPPPERDHGAGRKRAR